MKNSITILLMQPQMQSIPRVLCSDPQPQLVPARQLQALHPDQPPLEKTLGWYFRKPLFLFTLLTLLVVEWRATYRENLHCWDLWIPNPSRNPQIYGHSITMPMEAISTEQSSPFSPAQQPPPSLFNPLSNNQSPITNSKHPFKHFQSFITSRRQQLGVALSLL